MMRSFLLGIIGGVVTLASPAIGQDAGVITFPVERTTEPTDNGAGAEVTFNTEAIITRDLSANGQQGYDIDAVRTQTVSSRDGSQLVIRTEIDGRGPREVTVERIDGTGAERPDASDKLARPVRSD